MRIPRTWSNFALGLMTVGLATATLADPIHEASKSGDVEAVSDILSKQPKALNAPDTKHGNTPLHWASYEGHLEVVELLLKQKNTKIDAKTKEGYTPLRDAAYKGNTRVVKLLLEHRANANEPDKKGATPLHWAAHGGQTEAVKLILEAEGADVLALDNDSTTPIDWARDAGHSATARLLRKYASQSFHFLVAQNELDKVRHHLQTIPRLANEGYGRVGPTPNNRPLTNANTVEMTRLLLQNGADPELPVTPVGDGTYQQTSLHAAATAEILEEMLKAGGDPNIAGEFGKTPLHDACWSNNTEKVSVLLKHGAKATVVDSNGNTPLHNVCSKTGEFLSRRSATPEELEAQARMLIESGADVNAKNKEGLTPLQVAEAAGHTELVTYLRSAGAE